MKLDGIRSFCASAVEKLLNARILHRKRLRLTPKMKRSLMAALTPVFIAAIAFSAQTYAFFSESETGERGAISPGNVAVSLLETAIPAGGGAPVVYEDPVCVMPGTEVSKIVSVRNEGTLPVYIRVKIEKEFLLSAGNAGGATDPALVSYNLNTAAWTERNGYYYYNQELEPGEEATPLFTVVRFDPNMGNLYKESQLKLHIYADATQADFNGASPLEADGWPEGGA